MSDVADVVGQVKHLTERLRTRLAAVENPNSTPLLHWGQFVLEGRPKSQVGLYGSACATIILRLDRADAAAHDAARNLASYIESPDAEIELGHNIKLAMVCLALAPQAGNEATPAMLHSLQLLLGRYTTARLWPAFSRPEQFQQVHFTGHPSEVASAIIVVLLHEVHRRLTHRAHVGLRGQIEAMLKNTADSLENAHVSQRTLALRHGNLIATAIILVKGAQARSTVTAAFKDAVQKKDFADRRVFFYDCLRKDGSPSRDYFILPAAILLPIVAGAPDAGATQRALALDAGRALIRELDDDGVFKGSQELPSTVEQGMAALALSGFVLGLGSVGLRVKIVEAWLYLTQPSPSGRPTKLVTVVVVVLWLGTAVVTAGKLIPAEWRGLEGVSAILERVFAVSSAAPDALSEFLAFLCAALPASRAVFKRFFLREPL